MTTTSRVALGTGALFLGGALGGVVGAWMVSRTLPAGARATGERVDDRAELAGVLRELVDEVARLRRAEPIARAAERAPADPPANGTTADAPPWSGSDAARIVDALDRLTQALASSAGRAAAGEGGKAPLVLPPEGSRKDGLAALVGRGWEELSREHRFWTYQQVLDRYGPPQEVTNGGQWLYHYPDAQSANSAVFRFNFNDGYLTNIYP